MGPCLFPSQRTALVFAIGKLSWPVSLSARLNSAYHSQQHIVASYPSPTHYFQPRLPPAFGTRTDQPFTQTSSSIKAPSTTKYLYIQKSKSKYHKRYGSRSLVPCCISQLASNPFEGASLISYSCPLHYTYRAIMEIDVRIS